MSRSTAAAPAAAAAPSPAAGSRKISFNVSEQYDIQDVVGEGAYGVVWYVSIPRSAPCACPTTLTLTGPQLCNPQAVRPEGRH